MTSHNQFKILGWNPPKNDSQADLNRRPREAVVNKDQAAVEELLKKGASLETLKTQIIAEIINNPGLLKGYLPPLTIAIQSKSK
jgi:hypothetical protein